ncbi:hypothetical protein A3765_10660 [Oleiphilus sp. HI0130]|nr:hypothetical protein A3765_10660 [Oleiphilus sp. HI0130]
MDEEAYKKQIAKLKELKRSHANHYQWHDKTIKELIIGLDFFAQLEESLGERLINIEPAEDPPDVKITTSKDRVIGVEITELVDQQAIEYSIKGDPRYSEKLVSWNKETTLAALDEIISSKNKKCNQAKENYECLVLLIFTSEPRLVSKNLMEYISGHDWQAQENIDAAYILIGYDPEHGGKSLMQLF